MKQSDLALAIKKILISESMFESSIRDIKNEKNIFHGMRIILIATEKGTETRGEISNKEVFSFSVAKQRSL